jgi:biopolymer transport protein ExbD
MWKRVGYVVVVGCVSSWLACGGGEKPPEAPKIDVPPLGVLELPVSLRSGDAPPADARKVEVSQTGIRVDDQPLLALEGGKVPAAERSNDEITKLKAALQSPAKPAVALSLHASLAYDTAALAINTIKAAGISQLSLQVRKPGASTTAGWMTLKSFQTTPRTDAEIAMPNVDPHTWDDFTGSWQAIYDACRTAQTGSCAYVETNVEKGGHLQIVLHAAGQGVNVDFFRVGISPEQLAAEAAARKAEQDKKKEDVIQGRVKQTDVAEDLAAGDPANQALFQFRDREALANPSPISDVMKPLCGSKACGAVLSAESTTLAVRVVSLIGAAFPDGAAPPIVAFELPWTEKPKPPPAAAAAAPAAAPAK